MIDLAIEIIKNRKHDQNKILGAIASALNNGEILSHYQSISTIRWFLLENEEFVINLVSVLDFYGKPFKITKFLRVDDLMDLIFELDQTFSNNDAILFLEKLNG